MGERILKTGYHLSNVTVKSMVAYFLITHSAEPTMKVNSNNQLYSSKKTFDSSINEEKIQKKKDTRKYMHKPINKKVIF